MKSELPPFCLLHLTSLAVSPKEHRKRCVPWSSRFPRRESRESQKYPCGEISARVLIYLLRFIRQNSVKITSVFCTNSPDGRIPCDGSLETAHQNRGDPYTGTIYLCLPRRALARRFRTLSSTMSATTSTTATAATIRYTAELPEVLTSVQRRFIS